MTMTIVGYDAETGQFGGGVATKNPAVGSRVLRGIGEVGMVGFSSVETQRRRGIAMLQLGFPADVTLEALIKVSNGAGQYSLIDRTGQSAAYTSPGHSPWAGSRTGKHYACSANTMVGPEVVQALGDTFEETEGDGDAAGGEAAEVFGGGTGNGRRPSWEAGGGHTGALEEDRRKCEPGRACGRQR